MESVNNCIDVDDHAEKLDFEIEEASASVEPSIKKAKSSTSECWKYFTKIGPGKDGIDRARCNACKQEYKVGGKQYGTSTLNRHLSKCKQIKFEDVGQVMLDMQGKLKSMKIDQRISRDMYAEAVIEHGMPFRFAEYKKFRRWHSYICPDLIHISRNTLKKDVYNLYLKEKEKLKNTLVSIRNKICLTSDLWKTVNGNGYICLTAHYVDTKWRLNSKILNFCQMPPPHTGFELSQKILDMLKDWEIEKKIFSITLDNASANDTMEGLKVSNDALYRIRESVRWNSTYLMLESVLKYKRGFVSLQLSDRNYKDCPTTDDWERGEKLCRFL
ncbi:zinc finger BED domain-containing protein RICESLEEPER 3-like [Gastrolobium bilobum]|uniref:zinc finger BED domain-containing protein RICESLEEPER 3-like n=1 Tax=Gastrolobium bilobum TaxID=150636 RepID=UPI002AB25624|nr:zinc finger BED domain-containing protein RICESLEEPER 3-like [Gastrolobium bilobum]